MTATRDRVELNLVEESHMDDDAQEPQNATRATTGRVIASQRLGASLGRSQSGSRAVPDELIIDVAGDVRYIRRFHDSHEGAVHAFPPLRAFDFATCPICLDAPAITAEDVPPRSIGGSVLTRTCSRCNNGLGSAIDRDFSAFVGDELVEHRVQVDGLPGIRRMGRAAIRRLGTESVLIPRDPPPADVGSALDAGAAWKIVDMQEPDMGRVTLGILKAVLLASCVAAEKLLESRQLAVLREDLLTARDSSARAPITPRGRAQFRRGPGEPERKPTQFYLEDGTFGVSLAQLVFVSWPFDDLEPPIDRWRLQ